MAKLYPKSGGRPKADWYHFKCDDPLSENPLECYLKPLDPLQMEAADEYALEFDRYYRIGGWRDIDGKVHAEPLPLAAVDGDVLVLSEAVVTMVARLERMQGVIRAPLGPMPPAPIDHPSPEDRYLAEELLANAVCYPTAWTALQAKYRSFIYHGEGWSGKDVAASTVKSQEPHFE